LSGAAKVMKADTPASGLSDPFTKAKGDNDVRIVMHAALTVHKAMKSLSADLRPLTTGIADA